MTLQNRVNPLGDIMANEARGMFMGNRGILHDENKKLGKKRWAHKNWVCCALEYKGRRREMMAPGNYTELFFLDEATALTAGHRPCGECRRAAYNEFMDLWRQVNDMPDARAKDVDHVLHQERVAVVGLESLTETHYDDIPPGAFFVIPQSSTQYLRMGNGIYAWTFSGYSPVVIMEGGPARLLTPRSIANVIAAGYKPEIHPSATGHPSEPYIW